MRTHIKMVKPSSYETGIYKFDGNSLKADVQDLDLTNGIYITDTIFYEHRLELEIRLSNNTSITVSNFLSISNLSVEAVNKRGLPGTNGLQGLDGLDGKSGNPGLRGVTGPTGVIGFKGDKGEIGPLGEEGDKGPQGAAGPIGSRGPAGHVGLNGRRGDLGPSGKDGVTNIFLSQYPPDKIDTDAVSFPVWIQPKL